MINKLECLSMVNPFQQIIIFAVKAKSLVLYLGVFPHYSQALDKVYNSWQG